MDKAHIHSCTCARMRACMCAVHARMHVHVCACARCARAHAHMHACALACACARMCTHMYICVCMHARVCMCHMCVCTYACVVHACFGVYSRSRDVHGTPRAACVCLSPCVLTYSILQESSVISCELHVSTGLSPNSGSLQGASWVPLLAL